MLKRTLSRGIFDRISKSVEKKLFGEKIELDYIQTILKQCNKPVLIIVGEFYFRKDFVKFIDPPTAKQTGKQSSQPDPMRKIEEQLLEFNKGICSGMVSSL